MRLTTMTDPFRTQLNDSKMKVVPFEDWFGFGMMVDIEFSSRKSNLLRRLIRNAELDGRGVRT